MKCKRFLSRLLVVMMAFSLFTGMSVSGADQAGVSGKYVINIIWDGLSDSLYNTLKASGGTTTNIDELIARGTKLDNVATTIPSYGGAQAALITGAYPGTNNFAYRYYDKNTNTIVTNTASTYNINGQTIFEAFNSQKPELKTLVSGYSVASLSINNRGVSTADETHKLIEYAKGDSLVGFSTAGNDIINAINSTAGLPSFTLAYSNDMKMLYWNGGASDQAIVTQKCVETLKALDSKLGEIITALKTKGIYDDTIIVLNSLAGIYTMKTKIDGTGMATDITNSTGVQTTFGTVSSTTKAVIVKTYIMKYGQLSFTNLATQDDKNAVLAYLGNPQTNYGKYINKILNPVDYKAPLVYADYLLDPIDDYTFSAAGTGSFRTDNIDDMNQFCVVSGTGVIKNASVTGANVVDIAPTICSLLGINPPANNEGVKWDIFDLDAPLLDIVLDGQTNSEGAYTSKVNITINASDNKGVALLQYDIGEGFIDYTGPFYISKDCTLRVKAVDVAGNIVNKEEGISFEKLIDDVSLSGDYDKVNEYYYTGSSILTVNGTVLTDDSGLSVDVNGSQVPVTDKAFTSEVALQDGLNSIIVQASLNDIGNSVYMPVFKVFNPVITSLKDGDVFSTPEIDLTGKVVPGSSVTVNGNEVIADAAGVFTYHLGMTEGLNNIKVKSIAGKYINETDLAVGYYIPAQINITSVTDKQVVRTETVNIAGTVDKECKVTINGEAVTLGADLSFADLVSIVKGVNTIKIDADYHGVVTSRSIKIVRVDPNEVYMVYINWDGFAKYYYDLANTGGVDGTPVLNSLVKEGVLFDDAYTGIPSITNPMQASIVSGAWPATTGNCYRYYDKNSNTVIQFAREDNAETISEAANRQGLKTASVNQFALQDRGNVTGNPDKPYIDVGGDYSMRFDAAIKLVKGETIGEGAGQVQLDEIPRFMALYMDDLDGIGHNEENTYGVPTVSTEAERKASVIARLKLMDAKLGEFIQACKDRGIYDNMAFVLTTDHGMAPFGQQGTEVDDYTYSKLPDLISMLDSLGYKAEVLFAGQQPAVDTDIVIVCVGLQAQLSFTGSYTESDIDKIVAAARQKVYAGEIMNKDDMAQRGVMDGFADLLISPKAPYSFKTMTYDKAYIARGQHDSLDEQAQHIFALMWGKGIKKGYVYQDKIYNIDFAPTMTALMGIDKPAQSTGKILLGAVTDNTPPVITVTGVKNGSYLRKTVINVSVNDGRIDKCLLNGQSFNGGEVTASGNYTLYVEASDIYGNTSKVTIRFTIDSTPPAITVTGVKDGDVVREVRQIKICVNEGFITKILLNGKIYVGGKIEKPGKYVLYVKAADILGNTSEKTITFTIDKLNKGNIVKNAS